MLGGWTMSMAWMRMPGQTWLVVAASFLGMWIPTTAATLPPSLIPMLQRYRQSVVSTRETHLGALTALVGIGYFFVWTVLGLVVFPLGVALAELEMQKPMLADAVPVAVGVVVLIAAFSSSARGRRITLPAAGRRSTAAARCRLTPARPGDRACTLGFALQPLLCRSDGDLSPGGRGDGPSRDGCRGGRDHR